MEQILEALDPGDELSWQLVAGLVLDQLPHPPATILDCGDGHWSAALSERGHSVITIPMEATDLAGLLDDTSAGADLVLALDSLPSRPDQGAALTRITRWLRPGGWVVARTGSLIGTAQQLLDAGDHPGAVQALETRKIAGTHLLDAESLHAMAQLAGLTGVSVHGLLVSWSSAGEGRVLADLALDHDAALATEIELALETEWADLGRQLLLIGQSPVAAHRAPRWTGESLTGEISLAELEAAISRA